MKASEEYWIQDGILVRYLGEGGDLTLPEEIREIGSEAFRVCQGLRRIVIPKGVKQIGIAAFSSCTHLEEVVIKGEEVQVEYCAFSCCYQLHRVAVEGSLKTVKDFAFEHCTALSELTLPEGLTRIGYGAFRHCTSLEKLCFPESLSVIHDRAFSGCLGLTAIRFLGIPQRLLAMPFHNCLAICRIETGDKELFDRIWTKLHAEAKQRILLTALREQDEKSFARSKMTHRKKILIRELIEADDAEGLALLLDCYRPLPLSELDGYLAAAEEKELTKGYLLEYKNRCYPAERLEKLLAEETEKELGLRERSLSEWRRHYLFSETEEGIVIRGYRGGETEILVPDRIGGKPVIAIAEMAFSPKAPRMKKEGRRARKAIRSVVLPEGLRAIGAHAFWWCSCLEEIRLPESLTELGEGALSSCSALREICLPHGIRQIPEHLLGGCIGLERVELPRSLEEVGLGAFAECHLLERVELPRGVRRLRSAAFQWCSCLEEVFVPSSVEEIEALAFFGSNNMTLRGKKGSYAQAYAKKNGIPFTEEEEEGKESK